MYRFPPPFFRGKMGRNGGAFRRKKRREGHLSIRPGVDNTPVFRYNKNIEDAAGEAVPQFLEKK